MINHCLHYLLYAIYSEISGLEKAIDSLEKKMGLTDLFNKFKESIDKKNKEIESFDLAEILFRQNVRFIKKQLSTVDVPKHLISKK